MSGPVFSEEISEMLLWSVRMKSNFIFITDTEYFDHTALRNPVPVPDHKLEIYYPELYRIHYDVRLLAVRPASESEKDAPFYNDYREKYGSDDINSLNTALASADMRNVFLNGFQQSHFQHIVPLIKDSAEVLYLFKCPKIHDLSALSRFSKLKCVFIYWNDSLKSLWDMSHNVNLKVISFSAVSKLCNVDALQNANVEYLSLDSSDLYGHAKEMLFDKAIFGEMPYLKHLTLVYKDCNVNY